MLQVYPASGEHQPVPLPLKAGEALQEARHPCLGPVHLPVLEPAQRSRPGGAHSRWYEELGGEDGPDCAQLAGEVAADTADKRVANGEAEQQLVWTGRRHHQPHRPAPPGAAGILPAASNLCTDVLQKVCI